MTFWYIFWKLSIQTQKIKSHPRIRYNGGVMPEDLHNNIHMSKGGFKNNFKGCHENGTLEIYL